MNRVRAGLAAMILPAAMAAQQPTTPPQANANPVTMEFKSFGGHYASMLMAAFDSIPAARYTYRPTPAQQTIGYIAQHLENANYRLCEMFSGRLHPMSAKDSLADTLRAMWPKDTLIARFRASLVFCGAEIDRLHDTMLADELPSGPSPADARSVRARYLLFLVTDLAEHYSQIASYMRLLGMTPPSALPRPKP